VIKHRGRVSVRLGLWLSGFALAGLLFGVATASATFHLMKIREVYPAGSAGYVELQLLETGEYQVGGHHLVYYNADGTVDHDFTLPTNASAGSRANATVLITGPGYSGPPSTDEADAELDLSAAGGAVCWVEGEPPDCVAWGNFTATYPAGNSELLVGNPASPGGVTAGKALRRSIADICPTFLEGGDDTDDSYADFSEVTPNPRNNASTVIEERCNVAETAIDSKPNSPTNATSASFTYHAVGSSTLLAAVEHLECKLDEEDYVVCDAQPFSETGLEEGPHTFQVRAQSDKGAGLPAIYTWNVDTQAPTTSIVSHPGGTSDSSVEFTYDSSELGSTFVCSLAGSGAGDSFSSCPTFGKTYSGLADGSYTFKVRATDRAGNAGSTASYTWQVDGSSGTVTPPPPLPPAPVLTPVTIQPQPQPSSGCRKGFVKRKVRGKRRCVRKRRRCRRVRVVVRKHGKKVRRWRRRCVRKRRRCRWVVVRNHGKKVRRRRCVKRKRHRNTKRGNRRKKR